MSKQNKALSGKEGSQQGNEISNHRIAVPQEKINSTTTAPTTEKPVSNPLSTYNPRTDFELREYVDGVKRRASMREWLIYNHVEEQSHNRFICPIHPGESEASFSVHESDAYATDFHDNKKYDHIAIVRAIHKWGFWEALKALASYVGVPMISRSNGNGKKPKPKRIKNEFTEEDTRKGYGDKVFVREHNYRDVDDSIAYKKVILVNPEGKKKPVYFSPNSNGTWKPEKGDKTILYNGKCLLHNDTVGFAEGCQDCDTLFEQFGIPAVTTGSAGDTKALQNPDILKMFEGKNLLLFYDNDKPGIESKEKMARIFKPVVASLKVIDLPGVDEGDDITDWFRKRGGTKEELMAIIEATGEYDIPLMPSATEYNLTEFGNADRFRDENGDKLCFVKELKTWFVWNGTRWKQDTRDMAKLLAKHTVRRMSAEARLDNDPERRKWKHAQGSETNKKVEAMMALAQPELSVEYEIFNNNHYMLAVKNGTIDVDTMEFRDSRREDYMTKIAGTHFDPDADCPLWRKFLHDIMEGKEDLIKYLQKIAGYCMTGDTSEQAVFILYGCGANGKSTFITLLSETLGEYADSVNPQAIMRKDNNNGTQANSEIAKLPGARLVSTIEPSESKTLDEALIKQITGGDRMSARFLFQNEFTFLPVFKLLIATNHMPYIRGTDHAIWRRIHKIPFNAKFEGERKDDGLKDKLRMEKPGILNWLLEGYQMWEEERLSPPAEVVEATREYKADMDVVAGFLEECCVASPTGREISSVLHQAYEQWCQRNGEFCLKQKSFSKKLVEKGFRKDRDKHNAFFHGIKLIDPDADTTPPWEQIS